MDIEIQSVRRMPTGCHQSSMQLFHHWSRTIVKKFRLNPSQNEMKHFDLRWPIPLISMRPKCQPFDSFKTLTWIVVDVFRLSSTTDRYPIQFYSEPLTCETIKRHSEPSLSV